MIVTKVATTRNPNCGNGILIALVNVDETLRSANISVQSWKRSTATLPEKKYRRDFRLVNLKGHHAHMRCRAVCLFRRRDADKLRLRQAAGCTVPRLPACPSAELSTPCPGAAVSNGRFANLTHFREAHLGIGEGRNPLRPTQRRSRHALIIAFGAEFSRRGVRLQGVSLKKCCRG